VVSAVGHDDVRLVLEPESACGEMVGGGLKRVVIFPALQNPTPDDRIMQTVNHFDSLTHGENLHVAGWRRRMWVRLSDGRTHHETRSGNANCR
jgi:hypothetical protein